MLYEDDPDEGSGNWKHDLKVAVLSAALVAMATGLVNWGIDELRSKFGKSGPSKPTNPPTP